MRKLVVVSAGLSTPSSTRNLADRLAQAAEAAVTARGEALKVTNIEVRDLVMDLATAMTAGGIGTPKLNEVKREISAADGMIAVTPVFSASFSGVFKMFFDALDTSALNGMPVLIGATAGTPRHSLVLEHAMRPLFTYLRATVVPTSIFAATEDFGGGAAAELEPRITRAAGELASLIVAETDAVGGLGGATAHAMPRRNGVDLQQDGIPSFASLLRGHTGE